MNCFNFCVTDFAGAGFCKNNFPFFKERIIFSNWAIEIFNDSFAECSIKTCDRRSNPKTIKINKENTKQVPVMLSFLLQEFLLCLQN